MSWAEEFEQIKRAAVNLAKDIGWAIVFIVACFAVILLLQWVF